MTCSPPSAATSCRSKRVARAPFPRRRAAAKRPPTRRTPPFRPRPRPGGLVQHRQGHASLKFRGRQRAAAARRQHLADPRRANDLPVTFDPGGAVPGDRIVGVLMPGEGIRIFQIHSPKLREYEHEGWIDVTWDVDPERRSVFRHASASRPSTGREAWPRSPKSSARPAATSTTCGWSAGPPISRKCASS